MSVRADVETLRNIPIFSECEAVHLQLLAFSAVRQNFAAGDFVIRQGNTGMAAFLVLSGETRLSSIETGPLGSAGPGALLGEVAMIGDRPYSVTATAVEPVRQRASTVTCSCGWRGNFPNSAPLSSAFWRAALTV